MEIKICPFCGMGHIYDGDRIKCRCCCYYMPDLEVWLCPFTGEWIADREV